MFFLETSILVFAFMVDLLFTMVSVALDLFFGATLFILCADCQVQDIIVATTSIDKIDSLSHAPASASLSESAIQHSDRGIHELSDKQRIAQFEIDVETLTERLALRENEVVAFEHLTAYLGTVIEDKNVQISTSRQENEQEKIRLEQEKTTLQQERATLQQEKATFQHEKTTFQHEKTTFQHEKTTFQHEKTRLQQQYLPLQIQTHGLFIADLTQALAQTRTDSMHEKILAQQELDRAHVEILENKADAVRHSRKVKRLSSVVKQRGELALKLARRPIFFDPKSLPGGPIAAMLPTPPASPALVNASFDNELQQQQAGSMLLPTSRPETREMPIFYMSVQRIGTKGASEEQMGYRNGASMNVDTQRRWARDRWSGGNPGMHFTVVHARLSSTYLLSQASSPPPCIQKLSEDQKSRILNCNSTCILTRSTMLVFVFMVNLLVTMVSVTLDLFFRAALFILRAACQIPDIIEAAASISSVGAVSHTPTSASLPEAAIQHSEGNIHRDLSDEQRAAQLETRVEALKQRLALRENANAALQRKYLALREDAHAALQRTVCPIPALLSTSFTLIYPFL
ncbi:uncharacterized protein STEHIDRAFT_114082 [Stereum hirsutum FP-91666 SS1]|uniref:uncharacterized protein n=1 Tax=Stereum hirsutum (strain FP-91666) TaxID=721885 RepID=UPI0004449C6C|nr:uncharacterized protein STEHIDRAFT_114082 [Stereum hirsutum FP-91666 SS1]EIM83039.1 hypothetical protein STEHIDRAFT_114082 [Stereum hirsutum FP-91666 SS1]